VSGSSFFTTAVIVWRIATVNGCKHNMPPSFGAAHELKQRFGIFGPGENSLQHRLYGFVVCGDLSDQIMSTVSTRGTN